jgi:hypothetical protein
LNLEFATRILSGYIIQIQEEKMPYILLWLLGIPIPIIILLILLWH